MTRQQLVFRAALSRLVLGSAALILVPQLFPDFRRHVWIFAVYLVVAAGEQILIRFDIGGRSRSLFAGLVDATLITFVAHALGSTSTVFASLYFFAGMMNAMVVGLRVGTALAIIDAIAYGIVVWSEHYGVLPFAPDVPELAVMGAPSLTLTVWATSFVAIFLVMCTVIVGMLVTQLRTREVDLEQVNRRLEDLSHRDPLTNLYNRRFVFTQLERELARAARGHPLALLMLDLDRFKHVNDTQGHLRGDMLLKEIAQALAATTRKVDVAARYGGDEFLVVLPDSTAEKAQAAAERVALAIREVGKRFDASHPVTASVGVACAAAGDSIAALLRRADENAYRAKQRGGDRVVA
jgi:diguanylate cyclase (GGDEF)-like protein